MKVKDKLKGLRKSMGKSQKDVSSELNIGQDVYSRYETGKRIPQRDVLIKIANFFEVPIDYFLVDDYDQHEIEKLVASFREFLYRKDLLQSTLETYKKYKKSSNQLENRIANEYLQESLSMLKILENKKNIIKNVLRLDLYEKIISELKE